jgi:hypothetical protein
MLHAHRPACGSVHYAEKHVRPVLGHGPQPGHLRVIYSDVRP